MRYSLALVELACYRFPKHNEKGILVVPRIVQHVAPIQRAYVRVELAEGLQGKLAVTPVVTEEPRDRGTRPVTLNEDEFLLAVEQSAGAKCRAAMERFYNDLVESLQLERDFKASTLVLKVPHPDGEYLGVSVLALEKEGRIYNIKHMRHQLKRWGLSNETVDAITSEYWNSLHQIDARFSTDGITHVAPRLFLPFVEVLSKTTDIRNQVGKVVATIRAEAEKVR